MQSPALHRPVQIRARHILLICVTLIFAQSFLCRSSSAEESPPLSPSVVLALKLISTTHVNPVTGVVISGDGKVLVPADFVMEDGEYVVLDGGTDITSHGRPATILEGSMAGMLAILDVEGLDKPAITVSESAMRDNGLLHLVAFPLAKRIAAGDKPLRVPVRTQRLGPGGAIIASDETPLPNVFGPIMDACGYLAGLNLAVGLPSMDVGGAPVTLFSAQLLEALDSINISLKLAECPASIQADEIATPKDEQASKDEEANVEQLAPDDTADDQEETTSLDTPDGSMIETTDHVQGVEPSNTTTSEGNGTPSLWRIVPLWLVWLTAAILAVAVWKIVVFLRMHRHTGEDAVQESTETLTTLASDEPDTARLMTGDDHGADKPGTPPADSTQMPDVNALPDGFNAVLVIEGFLAGDVQFKRYCIVNTDNINIVVGRGDADVSIEHPAVSRAHVRLEGDGESMTVSDLGSSNGTFIRGVPCLPEEIMFIESKDEILLGEVRFCFHLINTDTFQR